MFLTSAREEPAEEEEGPADDPFFEGSVLCAAPPPPLGVDADGMGSFLVTSKPLLTPYEIE